MTEQQVLDKMIIEYQSIQSLYQEKLRESGEISLNITNKQNEVVRLQSQENEKIVEASKLEEKGNNQKYAIEEHCRITGLPVPKL